MKAGMRNELAMLRQAAGHDEVEGDLCYTSEDEGATAGAAAAATGSHGRYRHAVEDESEGEGLESRLEDAEEGMMEFDSLISNVNHEIATLDSHLKAFQPGRGESGLCSHPMLFPYPNELNVWYL